MLCLDTGHKGSWVYASRSFAGGRSAGDVVADIKKRVFGRQVWLFDLDDTHARSPGKAIAKGAVGSSYFSPSYWSWCAKAICGLVRGVHGLEARMWEEYADKFLNNQESVGAVRRMFDFKRVSNSLYPGVIDFCSLVSESKRFYVTRNVHEVASLYSYFLGFDGFYPRASKKADVAGDFVRDRPLLQYYGIQGDSEDEAEMISALRFYGKDVLGILCSDSPVDLGCGAYDINTSKDQSGLVKLISE